MNEPKNANVGDEYREFDAEDPDGQQEFAEDADGGKSNRFPLMHIDPIFKHNPRSRFKYYMYDICMKYFRCLDNTC